MSTTVTGKVAHRLQGPHEEVGSAVGHHDHLDVPRPARPGGVSARVVQRPVGRRHRGPGALPRPLEPGRHHRVPVRPRLHGHEERLGQRVRVTGRHEQARVAHDVGEGAGVAGDDRDPARHRLDGHPAELLEPARGREGRDGQDVEPRVERGKVAPGRAAPTKVDPVTEVEPAAARSRSSSGPAPATQQAQVVGAARRRRGGRRPPCAAASRPTYPTVGTSSADVPGPEVLGVDAERDHGRAAGEALALADPGRLGVARRSGRRRCAGRRAPASGTARGSACRCSGPSTGSTARGARAAGAAAGSRPPPGRTAPRGCRCTSCSRPRARHSGSGE